MNRYIISIVILGIILSGPLFSEEAVFFTGSNNNLHIISKTGDKLISDKDISFKFFTSDKNKEIIGAKYFDGDGLQAAAIYNLQQKKMSLLSTPVRNAGQPSFSNDGHIAFTIGDSLFVMKDNICRSYYLATYSNLATISPDGNYAAYNDFDDRIHILNLETGANIIISPGSFGCYNPVWSPDSRFLVFSGLDGAIYRYDLKSGEAFFISEGSVASFSPDSKSILFKQDIIENHELKSTNILIYNIQTKSVSKIAELNNPIKQLGFTANNKICFIDKNENCCYKADIFNEELTITDKVSLKQDKTYPQKNMAKTDGQLSEALDVPYLHQVYDTPDWYNGHWACGPTTAMMLLAYYNILPEWKTECSSPEPHTNQWGRYICERYRFNEIDYNAGADDPVGNQGYGIYGYMWNGDSNPHNTMAQFYENHGFEASLRYAPPYSEAVEEIEAGNLYSICALLTSSGHIVLGHSLGEQERTIIVNDPYGNKNTPGYPSFDGKNAIYDWPGYDNGNENFNNVAWTVKHKYTEKEYNDTIVDDLDFTNGFYLHTEEPSTMRFWWDQNQGYKGHSWWTYSTAETYKDTCYAVWRPEIPAHGIYEVMAFIPANAESPANYKITHAGGMDSLLVQQADHQDSWVSIGTYEFRPGQDASVYLGDACGIRSKKIYFDAVKWVYIDSVQSVAALDDSEIKISPNPATDYLRIENINKNAILQNIEIRNISGRPVYSVINPDQDNLVLQTGHLAPGVYFIELNFNNSKIVKKVIINK